LEIPEVPPHSEKIMRAPMGFVSSGGALRFVHWSFSTEGCGVLAAGATGASIPRLNPRRRNITVPVGNEQFDGI
jgi:hypothetical protein